MSQSYLCTKKLAGGPTTAAPWNYSISFRAVLCIFYFHVAAIYGVYISMTSPNITTIVFNFFIYILTGIGITAGAHRLWSHRSYKAKMPLQIILMLFQSMALQYSVINWVTEHRLHHKYCDTDADPHNASRGLFFSHIGWALVAEHNELKKHVKEIDISDATSNPVLKFQKKHAYPVIGAMCFVIPTVVPIIFWSDSFNSAWHINILRLLLNLHATFLINSFAHKYGNKPYNINILPTQNNLVSLVICGEGFHNFHHSFPWDYRAAELGNNFLNLSSLFIDVCAWIGWAYDLKTANKDVIKARANRMGDGTDSWGKLYYTCIIPLLSIVIPTIIPYYYWEETLVNSGLVNLLQYAISLKIYSAAHRWGYRLDKRKIFASQNILLSIQTQGEGFHNYHHAYL